MNVTLDRSKDGSTQVLPQFRDTKLGQIRLWTTAVPATRYNIQHDWKTMVLYIVVNIVCLVTSLILLVSFALHTPGWIMFGVWGLLTLIGIACVILLFIRERPANSNKLESVEMENMHTKIDLPWRIPVDPVMDRAITHLVYHGHGDCEDCRLLRFRDEIERRVREWSKVGPPEAETFSYATVPTRTGHTTSVAGKPASTQLHSATRKGRPQMTTGMSPPKKEHPTRRHASIVNTDDCDDTDTDDDIFDDVDGRININFNNNGNDNSRMTPKVVITPPDATMENRFGSHSDGFVYSITSPHSKTSNPTDVTIQSEHFYQKKSTRQNSTVPRHSNVAKRRRGPVQKSLQRMKDKSQLPRHRSRQQNISLKTSLLKSPDFITSPGRQYDDDSMEPREKDVVVSVESSL